MSIKQNRHKTTMFVALLVHVVIYKSKAVDIYTKLAVQGKESPLRN
jgi:hypothetical protein